ncbi:S41 family peptidase [Acidicapsa dinghuensis]|uniref:S41 family peptidase n=1 Tax=Acidicapsa dinghuensis TaxID=2218256 RepID=A0ABW1EFX3_9BACT|nr:S41 family peptidase [Acidicapsa dinghuensis]
MSERIYACLLRLYPASFREAYGDAAMELFRERLEDERGFWLQLQLWLDVLFDLVSSVPRTHRCSRRALVHGSAQKVCGSPSFDVLEDAPLRPSAILFGGALALAGLSGLSVLIGRTDAYRPLLAETHSAVASRRLNSLLTGKPPLLGSDDDPDQARMAGVPGEPQPRSKPQLIEALFLVAPAETKLDAAERDRVVEAAANNLKEHYFDRGAAQRMAAALLSHEKNGDDNSTTDGSAFADLLTKQMREVGKDPHLMVTWSAEPFPAGPPAPPPGAIERYHEALRQNNCTFEKIEILPNNIGYLKLNSFPDTSVCESTAVAAMARLNNVDAIIFDLRDNGGGYPEMVSLLASYLFNHPVDWYDPRSDTSGPSRTQSPVPGSRFADKPVYILTSGRTISGAEQFCYNLKMLKRATLVGETTHGSAHIGNFFRLDDHFGMGIPETKPVNPYGRPDWEGTGVEPDVKVSAADALETAEKLLQNNASQEEQ